MLRHQLDRVPVEWVGRWWVHQPPRLGRTRRSYGPTVVVRHQVVKPTEQNAIGHVCSPTALPWEGVMGLTPGRWAVARRVGAATPDRVEGDSLPGSEQSLDASNVEGTAGLEHHRHVAVGARE